MSAQPDRVQAHTAASVNERIRAQTRQRLLTASTETPAQISERIRRLDQEWDIERWLEMNASALAFSGLLAGVLWNRRFLAIPCLVLPFLFQHAVHGWCPPIPILRRKGVRTQREIDEERFALKALRGDFDGLENRSVQPGTRSDTIWHAIAG